MYGNGGHSEETPWVPEQKDALSYPTGTTAETCALCYKEGVSNMPPGCKEALFLFHRLQSMRRPSLEEFPKNRYILSFWVTGPGSLIVFSNRVRSIAFMPFKHQLTSVTVLGESTRGRCSPFKPNAPTALFVALIDHWIRAIIWNIWKRGLNLLLRQKSRNLRHPFAVKMILIIQPLDREWSSPPLSLATS